MSDPLIDIERAPIQEAVFDVRAEWPVALSTELVEAIHKKLAAEYPDRKFLRAFEHTIRNEGAKAPVIEATPEQLVGGRFQSSDEKQVIQFRKDGYTFSRLRPYTHWEELFPQVKRFWQMYAAVGKPTKVTRIATRYINVVELPGESVRLEDYFTAPVPVPAGLPQNLETFLQRVVLRFDGGVRAVVTQAPSPAGKSGIVPVMFDIDVFKTGDFAEPDIWATFLTLRETKNQIFRSYLRPETFRLFR